MAAEERAAPNQGPQHSRSLLGAVVFLTVIGLLVIYTSSSIPAWQKFGDSLYFFRKQAMVACVGFFLIFVICRVPARWLELMTLPLLLMSIALVGLTMVPGIRHAANGATRWISLGGFTFQPVELLKLGVILFLSRNLGRPTMQINSLHRGLLPNLFVVCIPAALLMLQPDFGSTFLLLILVFLMFFVAGLSPAWTATGAVVFSGAVVFALWQAPYRMARLLSFLDPWKDVQRGGFQIIQSYLGFQNGGLLGVGLGESRQKLYFLPEAHTDFILAVIGEELGLIGVVTVIATFFYVAWLGHKITENQRETRKRFLGFGLTSLIALQACLNMGVAMGLLPTKGMPLPFVSSGSSSLIVFLVATGLLARLGFEAAEEE